MIVPLSDRARIVRRVSLSTGAPVVVDIEEGAFPCQLSAPTESGSGSPRDTPPHLLRWARGIYGPGSSLSGSSRIYVQGFLFECTSASTREIRQGSWVAGYEVNLVKVSDLYPLQAQLTEQNKTVVIAAMPCGLWSPSESHQDRGEYENWLGEAPVNYWADVRINRSLVIAGKRYRITSSVLELTPPRVSFEVRVAGG